MPSMMRPRSRSKELIDWPWQAESAASGSNIRIANAKNGILTKAGIDDGSKLIKTLPSSFRSWTLRDSMSGRT
jgi:hypothetical protein